MCVSSVFLCLTPKGSRDPDDVPPIEQHCLSPVPEEEEEAFFLLLTAQRQQNQGVDC